MAKIKVRVKPGQVLDTYEDGEVKEYTAGDELDMDEKDAEPILGSCVSRISMKKKKKSKSAPKKQELIDEEKTISG